MGKTVRDVRALVGWEHDRTPIATRNDILEYMHQYAYCAKYNFRVDYKSFMPLE